MPDRLEREIEEIIRGKGDLPEPPRRPSPEPRRSQGPSRSRRFSAGLGAALLAAAGLLLVSLLLWDAAGGLGMTLVLGATVLFILSLAMAFNRGPRAGYEKRWRGQPIEYGRGPSLGMRLRGLWHRLRR